MAFQGPPQQAHSQRSPSKPLTVPISKAFFECPGFPQRKPWQVYGFGIPKTEIDKFHFDQVNDLIRFKDPDFLFDRVGRKVGIPLFKKTKQWLSAQVEDRPKRGVSCPPVMIRSGSRIEHSTVFPGSPMNAENLGRKRTKSLTSEIDSLDNFDDSLEIFDWQAEERKAKEEKRMKAGY